LASAGIVVLATHAFAQSNIPGSLLPGQVERQFQQFPAIRPAPGGGVPVIPTQAVPTGAQAVRFTLDRILLDGNTRLPPPEVDAEAAAYVGREITLADLYGLANALTAKYRNGGYLLSQVIVPAQSVEAGTARLLAVEGFVAEVRIVGEAGADSALIARYAEKIRDTRPLTSAALERYMLLINDLPGTRASATLAPSKTEYGAAELTIQVAQRTWNAGVNADNRGGKALGDRRVVLDAAFAHVLGRNENTGVKIAASPGGELAYAALQHEAQLGSEGGKFSVGLTNSRAKPKERSFIVLDLETRATGFSATYLHPLLRSRAENVFVRAALTGHNGEERVFAIKDREDRIRALRAGISYDLADALRGTNLVDLEFSQGLNALGASRNGDPLLTRANGKVDFRKLNLFAARVQDFSPHWSLLAAFNGQYAFDDLLASELYGLGGDLFGRGYGPSELVGDHGAAFKLEFRRAGLTPFASLPLRLYAYYDAGTVWQRTPLNGQSRSESAASTGIGVRFDLSSLVSLSAELAKPLTRVPTGENDRSPRVFVGLSARL
jgi:hemolysin activation/secretion protein